LPDLPGSPPNAVLTRLRHNLRSSFQFSDQVQYAVNRFPVTDPSGQFLVLSCLGQGPDDELLAIHSNATN
jgi:hypothetical protein